MTDPSAVLLPSTDAQVAALLAVRESRWWLQP